MYRPYRPTKHAEERRLEMNLGTKEVKKALNHPECVYPAGTVGRSGVQHQTGRTVYVRDRIAVVVADDTGMTITILWRGTDVYTREDTTPPMLASLMTFSEVLS